MPETGGDAAEPADTAGHRLGAALLAAIAFLGVDAFLRARAESRARHPRRCVCGGDGRYLNRDGAWEACGNRWHSGRLVHKHGS